MNKFKYYFIYFLLIFLVSGCGTVKKAFDSERKNSSDEFLVEKRSPLSLPPEFDKLPIPNDNSLKNDEEKNEIEILLSQPKEVSTNNKGINKNLELLILEKIN
tara:strand:- start:272 stop:580 length:309 start_codon:yes stop_codon:yes gene_type:complete